jgi:hypothetical protein
MVLSFAALPPILFYRSSMPFVLHIVFSLHLYAFLLLLFCVALGIAEFDVLLLGGAGLDSARFDHTVSIALLLACATYLYAATRTVYGERGFVQIAKATGLSVAVAFIVLGYRFVLLPITRYSV